MNFALPDISSSVPCKTPKTNKRHAIYRLLQFFFLFENITHLYLQFTMGLIYGIYLWWQSNIVYYSGSVDCFSCKKVLSEVS